MTRERLFDKLKAKGVFWSYAKDISYEEAGERLFLEYLLKYGDFDDLVWAFRLYPKDSIQAVWEERMVNDESFIKTNVMLARLFFGMNVDGEYFKGRKNARFEKLRLLAS